MAVIKHTLLFLSNSLTKQSRAEHRALQRPVLCAHFWKVFLHRKKFTSEGPQSWVSWTLKEFSVLLKRHISANAKAQTRAEGLGLYSFFPFHLDVSTLLSWSIARSVVRSLTYCCSLLSLLPYQPSSVSCKLRKKITASLWRPTQPLTELPDNGSHSRCTF